ncbi:MAG TPA: amidohydrolase [Syntrophales bacterium]|nr:amidohydrolase [Syntrophales bacterium]
MQNEDQPLDILIQGGTLLSMAESRPVVEDPSIGIRDGKIAFVRTGPRPDPLPHSREVIDASGCLVMPGLINAHTHLPMVLFRGLADDLPLMTWLNDHIFPAEGRFITRDTVYAGSLLAMAEMILSGTTTFCDGYFFEGSVARAAIDAGMRGVVAQGFIDFPTPDRKPSKDIRTAAAEFVEKWRDRSGLITPALICHSPYACSPETLGTVKDVARSKGVSFLIHLSETSDEVEMILGRYGKRPARHLHDLGLLDERTVAAHCIWLDEEEIDLLAAGGVKVVHDPESNMKLSAGIAPVPAMMKRGIVVGLGTDGAASNNNLDLFGEMGMTAKLHKMASEDPTVLDAAKVVEMATIGGARALGLSDRIGSIEPGKCADLILIDLGRPHLTPLYNPYSHLVYTVAGADVTTSIIAGRIVMRDRKLRFVDLAGAMEEVRKIAGVIREAGLSGGGPRPRP